MKVKGSKEEIKLCDKFKTDKFENLHFDSSFKIKGF